MESIVFLTQEQALELHRRAIEEHGGSPGVRDLGLFSAAMAVPQQAFGGQYLHGSIAEMAAAYLFHLCMNHAFEDGNKRVAVSSALTFLRLNGYELRASNDELESFTLAVADGKLKKDDASTFFKNRARKPRKPPKSARR